MEGWGKVMLAKLTDFDSFTNNILSYTLALTKKVFAIIKHPKSRDNIFSLKNPY